MDELFQEINESETVTIDQNADYLAELVGEGKKFKTAHDLARGKAEADRYIELLKKQNEELKKEVNTRTSLDSFKTALEELRKPAEVESQPLSTPDSQAPKFDESSIEAIVETLLQKKEIQRAQETNAQKVSRVLEENFGSNAQAILNQKAREVGMSLSDLKEISLRSPQAFFRLVGAQEGAQRPERTGAVPSSSVNLDSPSQISPVRGRSYYERMKREQPTLYNDPKTTSAMIQDMARLGRDKFNAS